MGRAEQFQSIQQRSRCADILTVPALGTGIADHIAKSRPLAKELFVTSKPYSPQEYLSLAINEGLSALEDGNYGIGAVYVLRHEGTEYVLGGHNKLRSHKSSHPHAEEDVIDTMEAIERGEQDALSHVILVRPAPVPNTQRILVTSLEPCIGCVRRIATHKLDEVIIGAEDSKAGAMLGGREKLPGRWPEWMEKVKKTVADFDNPESDNYIDPKYRDLIWKTFLINVAEIDREMETQGLAGGGLGVAAQALKRLPLEEVA